MPPLWQYFSQREATPKRVGPGNLELPTAPDLSTYAGVRPTAVMAEVRRKQAWFGGRRPPRQARRPPRSSSGGQAGAHHLVLRAPKPAAARQSGLPDLEDLRSDRRPGH